MLFALRRYPHVQEIESEDIALEQELMVLLEAIQGLTDPPSLDLPCRGVSTSLWRFLAQDGAGFRPCAAGHAIHQPVGILLLFPLHCVEQAVHVVAILGRDFFPDTPDFLDWIVCFHDCR